MRRILLSSSALAGAAGFAFATSLAVAPAADAAPATNWSGWYAGASAGILSGASKIDEPYYGDYFDAQGYGGLFGADVGYNLQSGNWVYGVEGDISATSAGGSILEYDQYYTAAARISALGTLRGRVGYADGASLFYLTGGLAFADLDTSSNWPGDSNVYPAGSRQWKPGWTVGGGVEHVIAPGWTARLEGLYADFGKVTNYDPYDYGNQFSTTAFLFRAGLNYRFGEAALVASAPASSHTYNWAGWYGGASVGVVSATSGINEPYYGDYFDAQGYGGLFGADVGYNLQSGALVYGLEADIAATSAGGTILEYDQEYTASSHISALGSLRGRVGVVSGDSLFYLTGGLAFADVHTMSEWIADGPGYYTDKTSWKPGWIVGAGVEHALSSGWTARFEGLYADFGRQVNYDTESDAANTFDVTALLFRAGVNRKF